MAIFTSSVSSGLGLRPTITAYVDPIRLSVSTGLGFQPAISFTATHILQVSVAAGLGLQPAAVLVANRIYNLNVSSGFGVEPAQGTTSARVYPLTVATTLGLQPVPFLAASRQYSVSVAAGLGLQPVISDLTDSSIYVLQVGAGLGLQPAARINTSKGLSVSTGLGLQAAAGVGAVRNFSLTTGLGLQAASSSGVTHTVSVATGIGFSALATPPGRIFFVSASSTLGVSAAAPVAILGMSQASAGLGLQATIVLEHVTAQGLTGGPSDVLSSGLSGHWPMTYAETPGGVVLMANGVDPMIRWQLGVADLAGVQPPLTAPAGTANGLGSITGTRYLFARFVDRYGNPSNPSPAGVVQCGSDQSIDDITWSATSGVVTIEARSHGLAAGQAVILQGIGGLPLNGIYPVTVVDQDHFIPTGLTITQGIWLGGGSILTGVSAITYSGIPRPTQSKVAAIQLLRNLEGNLDVLYVETSVAPGTTSYVTSLSDEALAQRQAVVFRSEDGYPLGLRHAVPPSNRPYLVNYLGRIFAAGDVTYGLGNVQVTNGSTAIQGWGTQWPASLSGRSVYVKGARSSYGIASLNSSAQTISLMTPYSGSTSLFATYSIRSSPSDRKLIQWSEPDNPEAWPAWNALAMPEDNDEITGLFVRGTYLYIAERRHLWRFQFQGDPATGGHVFLQAHRGAINHRCIADADDATYILDEAGVYAFDGSSAEPIDEDIQQVFWQQGLGPSLDIDWSADHTLWHASADRLRTTIRWFVAVVGISGLTTALCYNYRLKRWWWEQYPVRVTSSCEGTLAEAANAVGPAGHRDPLVGAECRRVLVLGHGSLDLAPDTGTLRGSVGFGTTISITDPSASFPSGLAGCSVSIVGGSSAAGQSAIISSATSTTLNIVAAWQVIPQPGDIYQIGGIPWQWRSGWLDVEDEEGDTTRDFIVSFQTLVDPFEMSVQLYYDHATSPMAWGYSQDQDGVRVTAGSPDVWVDFASVDVLPGYRVFRLARHSERYAYSDRYIQILLSGVQDDETVRVYQVSLRGVDQEGV